MAAADVAHPPNEAEPAVPDYLASPNAVFEDKDVVWRYGRAPDYSKTRAVWEKTKTMSHTAGSLPQLVENLVKNWEVEASYKPRLQDWRTIDHANYSFAINGGEPQTAEHMLKVGTYNAILTANEYYSPEHSDFVSSHKTFKRMMPTFAWEVLEVYSGPPKVSFRWRHWGEMQDDYVGFNDKGEKITVKAHGGKIDIQGVTVAQVDDKVRLQSVETWFDPMEMFRQISPDGIVNKQIVDSKISKEQALDEPSNDGIKVSQEHNHSSQSEHRQDPAPESVMAKDLSQSTGQPADAYVPHQGASAQSGSETNPRTADGPRTKMTTAVSGSAANVVGVATTQGASMPIERRNADPSHDNSGNTSDGSAWEKVDLPHEIPESMRVGDYPRDMESAVQPEAGEAVAASAGSEETRMTHEEMSNITPAQCPFLMNRE